MIKAITLEAGAITQQQDGKLAVDVTVRNAGAEDLPAHVNATHAVRFSWRYARKGEEVAIDQNWAPRATLAAPAPKGASVVQTLSIDPPPEAGAFALQVMMVQDGVIWFHALGMMPATSPTTVTRGADGKIKLSAS